MLVFIFAYYIIMTCLPEYVDSSPLYWVMDSVLRISIIIYILINSKKSVLNLMAFMACISVFIYDLQNYTQLLLFKSSDSELYWLSVVCGSAFFAWYLFNKKRYEWKRLKSEEYNPKLVQAIYSKPNEFITVVGSSITLSPKCSVRYTYNGKVVRFKRGYPTPIMTNTIVKKTDIIENTNIDPECFYQRFDEIKNNKYNLFTFNCKHLFKKTYRNKVKELI